VLQDACTIEEVLNKVNSGKIHLIEIKAVEILLGCESQVGAFASGKYNK